MLNALGLSRGLKRKISNKVRRHKNLYLKVHPAIPRELALEPEVARKKVGGASALGRPHEERVHQLVRRLEAAVINPAGPRDLQEA